MDTTPNTDTRSARDLAVAPGYGRRPYTLADWSAVNEHADRLRELARHAEALGLEGPAESLHRDADDMATEADMIQLDLIARGIEP